MFEPGVETSAAQRGKERYKYDFLTFVNRGLVSSYCFLFTFTLNYIGIVLVISRKCLSHNFFLTGFFLSVSHIFGRVG